MKPVLFLDMDGVMNHSGKDCTWYKINLNGRPDQVQFSRKNINSFNKLIDTIGENKIDIVISSTWRQDFTRDEFINIFQQMKIKGNIIGYTPDLFHDVTSQGRRGDEIDRYIKDNQVKHFIVLDDDDEMVHAYIKERWVQTFYEEGLSDELVDVALMIFNNFK